MEKRNYIFIDALRGCAVLLVMFYHLIVVLNWHWFPERSLTKIFYVGWIGVDLFFVISGFVIALSILLGMERNGSLGFVHDYARHRLARIVPLYYLTTLLLITCIAPQDFWLHASKMRLKNVLTHLLFIHNWFPPYAGAINGAAWTLGVEMQFYVLIALLLAFWPKNRALPLVFSGIVTVLLWRTFCFHHWQGNVPRMIHAAQQLIGHLDAFLMGTAIALASRDGTHFLHKYLQPSTRSALIWFAVAVLSGVLAWHIFWPHSYYWHSALMVIGWRSLLALTFALFLLAAITLPARKWLVRALAPLLYTGKISYGIYLWHLPVIHAFKRTGLPAGRMATLAVLSTLLLATFSWYFFEKPLIDKYRK